MTTEYVEQEDRIRLVGTPSDDPGRPLAVWLTQRLLVRLAPVLLAWLENKAPTAQGQLVQEFAQHAARSALLPQPPVLLEERAQSWLAVTVDVVRGPDALRLIFRGDAQQAAGLVLEPLLLRQWLHILQQQASRACWQGLAWPAWLHEAGAAVGPDAVLH